MYSGTRTKAEQDAIWSLLGEALGEPTPSTEKIPDLRGQHIVDLTAHRGALLAAAVWGLDALLGVPEEPHQAGVSSAIKDLRAAIAYAESLTPFIDDSAKKIAKLKAKRDDLLGPFRNLLQAFTEHLQDHAHEKNVAVNVLCPCFGDQVKAASAAIANAEKSSESAAG